MGWNWTADYLDYFIISRITINTLDGLEKNGRESFDNLPFCTLDEQEIQKIKVDLESLFSLKSLLISKGLYKNQCAITT